MAIKPDLRIVIRAYVDGTLTIYERLTVSEEQLVDIAKVRGKLLAGTHHMIEIEFLDEPDPQRRYFRFGTDPSQMTCPVALKSRYWCEVADPDDADPS